MKTVILVLVMLATFGCAAQPMLLTGTEIACRFARTPAERIACSEVQRRAQAARDAADAEAGAAVARALVKPPPAPPAPIPTGEFATPPSPTAYAPSGI